MSSKIEKKKYVERANIIYFVMNNTKESFVKKIYIYEMRKIYIWPWVCMTVYFSRKITEDRISNKVKTTRASYNFMMGE